MTDLTDHDMLVRMYGAMFDSNGNPGLCSKVEAQGKAINRLWITIALIVPSSGGAGFAIAMKLLGQ